MTKNRFIATLIIAIFLISPVFAIDKSVLLVTSVYNNLVDVIDLQTKKSLGTITVGFVPHKMAMIPDTKFVYVANRGTKLSPGFSLSLIDLNTLKNIKTINLGLGCGSHGVTAFQGKIYAACFDASTLKRYDPATNKIDWEVETGKNPHEVVILPKNNKAYTANQMGDSISIIDIVTKNRTDVQVKPGSQPVPMAISPDQQKIWIGTRSGEIYILDTATNKIENAFKVGDSLFDLKFTPDGKHVIAANLKPSDDKNANTFSFSNGKLIVINPETHQIEKNILLNNNMPINISFSADKKNLFVSLPHTNNPSGIELFNPDVDKIAMLNNEIGIVDLKSLTLVGILKTATAPAHMLPTTISTDQKNSFHMQPIQTIASNNARAWEFFTIGDKKFLAAAEFTKDYPAGNKDIDSTIYQWDGKQFSPYQFIPTHGARYLRHVMIDNTHYLMIVNSQTSAADKNSYDVNSVLYRWDGKRFQPYQSFPTKKIINLRFFKVSGETYLALAAGTHGEEKNTESQSSIYKWNGKNFNLVQSIKTASANDLEALSIDGKEYLAVANSFNTSDIFQWNGKEFKLYQTLATKDARDFEPFGLNGQHFLAVANLAGDSMIFQWDENNHQFKPFQTIATVAARHWCFVKFNNHAYLISSNFAHGEDQNTAYDLVVYQYQQGKFEKVQNLSIPGGQQQTLYFQINHKLYIFVSVVFGSSQLYEVTA